MMNDTNRNSSIIKKPTLFLSYSQKDSPIANIIECQLKYETSDGIEISRYTRVPYNGSFKAFMNSIQEHDFVLCLVSDNYLKSQACMYEVGEIIKDHHFDEKLLFVVIGENDGKYYSDNICNFAPARIYGRERERLKYVKFWETEYEELKRAIDKIVDDMAKVRSLEKLKEIGRIYRNDISEFLAYLSDNNGKNFEELYSNHFYDIIKWIFPDWESRMFVKCTNMTELLTKAIEEICKITRTDYNQIALWVKVSSYETGLVVYADNVSDKKQRYRLVVMEGLIANAGSTGNIINIGNVKNEPQYFMAVGETKSELVVPIVFQEKTIGVINSESEQEYYYSKEVINQISCIANDLSIALKRVGYVSNMIADDIPYVHI